MSAYIVYIQLRIYPVTQEFENNEEICLCQIQRDWDTDTIFTR
jgi:hypothetical protein